MQDLTECSISECKINVNNFNTHYNESLKDRNEIIMVHDLAFLDPKFNSVAKIFSLFLSTRYYSLL